MSKRKIIVILSLIIVAALCFSISLAGCKKNNGSDETQSESSAPIDSSSSESVTEDVTIKLNKTSLELTKYETAVIEAIVSDGSVAVFSSGDENIASVTSDGVVTAKNVGACDIVASAGGVSAKCRVIVSVSPYTASIKGVIDDIRVAGGGEFKAQLYMMILL